jgi:virginiamycin B lyase
METSTMFPRFMPAALLRGSQDRQSVQDSRRRLGHRSPERNRARFRLEGLEDRCLLSTVTSVTEFPVPGGYAPRGIVSAPDGNLWFTDYSSANKIGMINPTTHAIQQFTTPTSNSWPRSICVGPDGNVWFAEWLVNKIGVMNPTTHVITEYPTNQGYVGPYNITTGPDGNVWFTEFGGNKLGVMNPTTHAVTWIALPTVSGATGPIGITSGPDGNVWFTVGNNNGQIGKINPTTHAITEFPLPGSPGEIVTGPDGNLWFTGGVTGYVGSINPSTGVISEFATPSSASLYGITSGPDGSVWFTENSSGKIGSINPATDVVTEYAIPYRGTQPWDITTGPDQNLWFADGGAKAIGVATLTTTPLVVTQQPSASVTAGSPFGLTVQAEDSSGNLVSSFNGTVTVALASNPGGSTLGGTLSVQASGGVATFSGLTLNNAGSGYVLYVSGGGLGWGVTNTIIVTGTATSSALAAPTTTPNPLLAPLVLDSPDLWDGLRFKKRSRSI